jgi:adenylate cyclase
MGTAFGGIARRLTGFRTAVVITACAAVCFIAFGQRGMFNYLELKALDMRFRLRGQAAPSSDVVILLVDDYSIMSLGQWPWPRSLMAEAIDLLALEGASVIGVDILWTEAEESTARDDLITVESTFRALGLDRLSPEAEQFGADLKQAITLRDHDAALAASIARAGNVVLPLELLDVYNVRSEIVTRDAETGPEAAEEVSPRLAAQAYADTPGLEALDLPHARHVRGPIADLMDSASALGFVNFFHDSDGALRWDQMAIEHDGLSYPPLVVQMLRLHLRQQGHDLPAFAYDPGASAYTLGDTLIPTDNAGRMLINYYGPAKTIAFHSFVDLLDGVTEPGAFEGKLVLIGAAASGLGDVWITPFDQALPGVEKHATVLSNILQREFIRRNTGTRLATLLVVVMLGLGLGLAFRRLNPVQIALAALAALGAVFAANTAVFVLLRVWSNVTFPSLTVIAVAMGEIGYKYFTESRAKAEIKKAFKQYLNPALVEQLAANPAALKLGGEAKELTVLFSDIRTFTSISENLSPEELVSFMNSYLSSMTRPVLANNGVVDKFIGDAIMAIFGAPVSYAHHPASACHAALGMTAALVKMRPEWAALGLPPINIGIGINTGRMVVGNMGSEDRFDYTVMGDSVNLASRLEGTTKFYGVITLVSERTRELAGDGFIFRELDYIRVMGKARPIKVYELMALRTGGVEDRPVLERAQQFRMALDLYLGRDWADAHEAFQALAEAYPDDLTASVFVERCERYCTTPPPPDWDGVYERRSK